MSFKEKIKTALSNLRIEMKNIKKKELAEEIENYFINASSALLYDGQCSVKVYFQDSTCTIHLSKMYEGLGDWVSYKNLGYLSKLLKTDEISLQDENYNEGCESCDYGSSHEVNIVCKNINLIEEVINQE